jgi:predicted nucleic-acid-binding protein
LNAQIYKIKFKKIIIVEKYFILKSGEGWRMSKESSLVVEPVVTTLLQAQYLITELVEVINA